MSKPVKVHAKRSPSSAERWWNCPGSINAIEEAGLPEAPESAASAEGTLAHSLLELILTMGGKVTKISNDIYPDLTMRRHIRDVADYILGHMEKGAVIQIEQEVMVHVIEDTGTPDAVILLEKHGVIHIFDLKYGSREVTAKQNKQMLLYLTSFLKHKWAKEFVLHICQPKVSEDYDQNQWTITRKQLEAFQMEAIVAVEATEDPKAPLVAGEKQCRYCPVAGRCRAYAEFALEGAIDDFADFIDDDLEFPVSTALSNQELTLVIARGPTMLKWYEAARVEAARRIVDGESKGLDLKLVEGKSNRRWADPAKVAAVLKKANFDEDQFAPRRLAGLGDISDLIKQAKSKKDADKFLDKFTIKPHGKPTLALSTDPRHAIPQRDAKKHFAEFLTNEDDE